MKKTSPLFYFFIGWMTLFSYANAQVDVVTNPKPTHDESVIPVTNLIPVSEITSNLADEFFLVRPWTTKADKNGNIYTFDLKNRKFFKYDKNLKLTGVFGKTGQGPGEYSSSRGPICFEIFNDEHIVISDGGDKKLIWLDLDGQHIKDYRINSVTVFPGNPAFDDQGRLFVLDMERNGLSLLGKNGEKEFTFFSVKDYAKSIVFPVSAQIYSQWIMPMIYNTVYHRLSNGQVIVFLFNTCTTFILEKENIVKRFNVWPKNQLKLYKEKVSTNKSLAQQSPMFMFSSFFVDRDDERFFYLVPTGFEPILKFDTSGRLVKRLGRSFKGFFHEKRNGFFYITQNDKIVVLKEEK